MGFKIGDRVRVNLPGSAEDGAYGEVVKNPYVGESGGFIGAFLTDGPCAGLHGLYMNDELAPAIAPRGPKPLTLNGGRPRFTVRQGYAVDRAGFRRYPLASYLTPFTGAKG